MKCSNVIIGTIGHIGHVDHGKTTLTAAVNKYAHPSYTHEPLYGSFIEWECDKEPIPVSLVKQGRTIKEHNNLITLNKKKRF